MSQPVSLIETQMKHENGKQGKRKIQHHTAVVKTRKQKIGGTKLQG